MENLTKLLDKASEGYYAGVPTLSDEEFEMPQSLAKTASYFINKAFSAHQENKDKNAKRKA